MRKGLSMSENIVRLWAMHAEFSGHPKLEPTEAIEKPSTYKCTRSLPGYGYKTTIRKKEAHLSKQAAVDAFVRDTRDKASEMIADAAVLTEIAIKAEQFIADEGSDVCTGQTDDSECNDCGSIGGLIHHHCWCETGHNDLRDAATAIIKLMNAHDDALCADSQPGVAAHELEEGVRCVLHIGPFERRNPQPKAT